MKVKDAIAQGVKVGDLIRVTHVATGEAEELGYVKDASILTNARGTVRRITENQIACHWEDSKPGSLMLAPEDEIELLGTPIPSETWQELQAKIARMELP